MARKDAPGLTAKAPKPTRNGERGKKQQKAKAQSLQGLTPGQNENINAQQGIDSQLLGQAGSMLPGAFENFQQPFQYTGPQAPVTGDYNQWVDEQQGNYNKAFDSRFEPQAKQVQQDFEQEMHNRGIPPGSPLYDKLYATKVTNPLNDLKTQGYAAGQSQATQNAMNLFNTGTTAQQNAYGQQLDERNRPLNEFNAIMGSTSGMNTQNLGYAQAQGLQQQGFKNDKWMMQNTPRGGGGGGGGAGAMWQQYGFSSPMEYDAYKMSQAQQAQSWEWANNPQYKQNKGPNPWASAAGQVGGIATGAWLGSLF